jgi:hypothetical protein
LARLAVIRVCSASIDIITIYVITEK